MLNPDIGYNPDTPGFAERDSPARRALRRTLVSDGKVMERNGGWTAIYDEPRGADGTRRQRWKGGFKTRPAAQAYLREQLVKIDKGSYVSPSRMKLATFLRENWLPSLADIRPSTRDSYVRIIEAHIIPALGTIELAKLQPERILRLYRDLSTAGLSPKTIRNVHGVLRTALGAAVLWSYLESNPATRMKPPKLKSVKSRSRDRTVWGPEELRAFLRATADDPMAAAWRLLITTGMRRGELLGLRWADLDLGERTATIRQTLVVVNYEVTISEPKTEAGERTLSLDPDTVASLRTHQASQAAERLAMGRLWVDTGLVFTAPGGEAIHPQRFSDWFQQRIRRAGLPRIRLHDVRHSYITAGLEAGVPMKVMSERAGHSTLAITADLYSHVRTKLDADAAEMVARVIDGVG
jgi:integrase